MSVTPPNSKLSSGNKLRTMEAALVAHIRSTLPNDTLKDLGQEIGFVDKDM